MAKWIQLTKLDGSPVSVNLDMALWINSARSRDGEYTVIIFPGDDDSAVKVKETFKDVSRIAYE